MLSCTQKRKKVKAKYVDDNIVSSLIYFCTLQRSYCIGNVIWHWSSPPSVLTRVWKTGKNKILESLSILITMWLAVAKDVNTFNSSVGKWAFNAWIHFHRTFEKGKINPVRTNHKFIHYIFQSLADLSLCSSLIINCREIWRRAETKQEKKIRQTSSDRLSLSLTLGCPVCPCQSLTPS